MYMWLCSGQNVRPLNKHEYILDVATEAELVDSNYSFWFRRVIWTQPFKHDNELCVAMHYNQVRLRAHVSTCVLNVWLNLFSCVSRSSQIIVKAC